MLPLRDWHAQRAASFTTVNGAEVVRAYAHPAAEYEFLTRSAGLLDLSFRGRICLLGADRITFLHGQVTNDINGLAVGQGCYAALVNSKAKFESDLWIYRLEDELLLDFEPGLTSRISARLEKYIIADDVQVIDVAPHFGMLSIQGPQSREVVAKFGVSPPDTAGHILKSSSSPGDIYTANRPRLNSTGFDLYIPTENLRSALESLSHLVAEVGGGLAGWEAFETARIEQGIPRFGADMDETNLPPEAGLEKNGISYSKGCYIGQEIIARIRTYGQVSKRLRQLRIQGDESTAANLPKGTKLRLNGKEAGYVTSAAFSPRENCVLALGYARREVPADASLEVSAGSGLTATIVAQA